MNIPKVFVNSKSMAIFSCDECGESHSKDVSKFIGHQKQVRLKYKCQCGHAFSVMLERRRFIRKDVSFKGTLIKDDLQIPITIRDISKFGLKINLPKSFDFELGEIIEIQFVLDDPKKSQILERVRVKNIVTPTIIGCEYLTDELYGQLGKYFVFHF